VVTTGNTDQQTDGQHQHHQQQIVSKNSSSIDHQQNKEEVNDQAVNNYGTLNNTPQQANQELINGMGNNEDFTVNNNAIIQDSIGQHNVSHLTEHNDEEQVKQNELSANVSHLKSATNQTASGKTKRLIIYVKIY
jgi:hypothetical protein